MFSAPPVHGSRGIPGSLEEGVEGRNVVDEARIEKTEIGRVFFKDA